MTLHPAPPPSILLFGLTAKRMTREVYSVEHEGAVYSAEHIRDATGANVWCVTIGEGVSECLAFGYGATLDLAEDACVARLARRSALLAALAQELAERRRAA